LQDDDEEGVDPEDLEEWPDEEMDGVCMWGPLFVLKWVRKNKFRTVVAGSNKEKIFAPPYYCGQLLAMRCDGECPEDEAMQLLGPPPPEPPKKVYDDEEDEELDD